MITPRGLRYSTGRGRHLIGESFDASLGVVARDGVANDPVSFLQAGRAKHDEARLLQGPV